MVDAGELRPKSQAPPRKDAIITRIDAMLATV